MPAKDSTIWRYMDLARFAALLSTRTLRFTKAAQFHDDPYEGYCRVLHRTSALDPRALNRPESGEKTFDEFLDDLSRRSARIMLEARDRLFINSWCMGDESMAMWQIYGAAGHGVAIKASTSRYRRSLGFGVPSDHYAFGDVQYHRDIDSVPALKRDVRTTFSMGGSDLYRQILSLGLHKRSCFEFEKEWRGLLYQDLRPESGCDIDCNLEVLVKSVCVGPRAEPYIFDLISSLMDRFGLQKPVMRSQLLQSPAD